MPTIKTWAQACILGLGAGCAMLGHGAEGALEINQACATTDGCFAGDTGGFPVTITATGSYLVTGNLEIAAETTDAIEVDASDVTLDLNGFAISGPVTCTGVPVSECTPNESTSGGEGVSVLSGSDNVTIRNGTIRGMGSDGIQCLGQCIVSSIRAESNTTDGIRVSDEAILQNNMARSNGNDGIRANRSALFNNNVAVMNGNRGIFADFNSLVKNSNSRRNGSHGIRADNSIVKDNVAWNNLGAGLKVAGETGYAGNHIAGNSGGTIDQSTGTAFELNPNLCNTDKSCP